MGYLYSRDDFQAIAGREGALFAAVAAEAASLGQRVYVVGGYVRDLMLGRKNADIDLVTVGAGAVLAQAVAKRLKASQLHVYKSFGTAGFRYHGLEVEFVGARKESYRSNSRKPIVEAGTLEEDLSRRDFTINALAISLNQDDYGTLIDLFSGEDDMEAALLRTPLEPVQTFSDDPLRMMRAVRFVAQLGFRLDSEAFAAMQSMASRLSIVSVERVMDEFNKILLAPVPSIGLYLLSAGGLMQLVLPELEALKGVDAVDGQAHKDNFGHTLQVVDNVAAAGADLWLRWAALLHDIGKTPTKRFVSGQGWTFHAHEFVGAQMVGRIFRRLHLPLNEKCKYVEKLVSLHMRPIALVDDAVTDSAVRRLLFDAGDDAEALMRLCEADITTKNPRTAARYMGNFLRVRRKMVDLEARDRVRNFQPPVTGEEIMARYHIGPCRAIGTIKQAIKDAILDGVIPNEKESALQYMEQVAVREGLVSPTVCGQTPEEC